MKVVMMMGMLLAFGAVEPAQALTRCELRFTLEGWSVFYKEAVGAGVVRCDNGQEARVELESRGGGITFGRSKIVGGRGAFSPIADIDEIFGDYADAQAHAGMGVSTQAHVVTKGSVSLTLSGTGNGVDLGFAFGRFTITPAAGRAAAPLDPPEVRDEPIGDEDLPADDPPPATGY